MASRHLSPQELGDPWSSAGQSRGGGDPSCWQCPFCPCVPRPWTDPAGQPGSPLGAEWALRMVSVGSVSCSLLLAASAVTVGRDGGGVVPVLASTSLLSPPQVTAGPQPGCVGPLGALFSLLFADPPAPASPAACAPRVQPALLRPLPCKPCLQPEPAPACPLHTFTACPPGQGTPCPSCVSPAWYLAKLAQVRQIGNTAGLCFLPGLSSFAG